MKRYQVQFPSASGLRVKALMDTDDYEAAEACRQTQAPKGWIIDTTKTPEKWIADA